MRTQQDHKVRVLALDNLREMCKAASGTAHRYWIEKVSRSRVHVGYSNPNEYGSESPMFAVLPCYPSPWSQDGTDNPRVVLDVTRVLHDSHNGEGWQAFDMVWQYTATRGPDGAWRVVTQ